MSANKIANRYASALLDLSKGQESLRDSLASSLKEISKLYGDKDIKKVLSSPVVSSKLLDEVFAHSLDKLGSDKLLKDLISLLIENRRTGLIPEISAAFHKKLQAERGIVDAIIEAAVELQPPEIADVSAKLEKLLGKKVVLSSRHNPTILGGFVIRIENNLLDMSLKTKLDNMIKTAVS